MIHNLDMFDHQSLNLSNLYFLIAFHKLLTPLQQDLNFMRQTLFKLSSLNWNPDQIKDVLFSLERQLITPISEEEKGFSLNCLSICLSVKGLCSL